MWFRYGLGNKSFKTTIMKLIYVVEDDKLYREYLVHELSKNTEAEIVAFENGKDCLAELYRIPDMIFLDYDLGDEKGTQILKEIRWFDVEIPVVFISGQTDGSIAANCLKYGAFDYISKDSEMDVVLLMLSKIENIIEVREMLRREEKRKLLKKRLFSAVVVLVLILLITSL